MSLWRYSNVIVVLQWCYCGVTVVLQWCYSGVTVVVQWCYSRVTVVSQWCYIVVLLWCYCDATDLDEGLDDVLDGDDPRHVHMGGDLIGITIIES
jgi:hypothetical protein